MVEKTFPGLSNIEAILRLIAGNVANINTAVGTLTAEMAVINATLATAFPPPLTSSVTWNPPSVADKASTSTTVTVTGAALGNYVQPSFSLDLQGMQLTGNISSANTATVVLSNLTGGALDLGSGTLKVRIYS